MDKLSKTAKTLDKIVGFLYWATILAAAFAILTTGVLALVVGKDASSLNGSQTQALTFGVLRLSLAPGVMEEIAVGNYGSYLLWTSVLSLVSAPVYCVALLTVRDILKPFIHRQPFQETVAKDLKRLAILVVADTALTWIVTGITDHMTRNLYDLDALFLGDRITAVTLSAHTLNTTPLLFAAALYLLSKVFLYGQELQKLSDETL